MTQSCKVGSLPPVGDLQGKRHLKTQLLSTTFEKTVARFPDRPCIDFLGRSYSYVEVQGLISRAAAGFQALGVAPGDRILLFLPNCPYFVICYYAALKIGAVVVNSNPLYAVDELAYQLKDSGAKVAVTLDVRELCEKVVAQLDQTALEKVVICRLASALPGLKGTLYSLLQFHKVHRPSGDRFLDFDELVDMAEAPEAIEVKPEDLAVLQYTGGTTGRPKGAMLTHANLAANSWQVSSWFTEAVPGEERILGILPLFHVFAMTTVMNMAVVLGAEMVLLPRFKLGLMLKTIERSRPTLMVGVPTLYAAVNNSPLAQRYDLSSIRYCISGGAALPLEVKHRFEELTGCVLVEGYGLTEASPVCACNPIWAENKEGSIGLPMPDCTLEIRNIEPPHEVLPLGEKGELCVQGPNVMQGYWHAPEAGEKVLAGGCLHTGDVGYMDEDGYVFLQDRLKDIIICNGYNVYPRIIEEAINAHPDVEEVTVVGIPDESHGEVPKAFIKLLPKHTVNEEQILSFLVDHLSSIEMPRAIEFRDELPRTLIGKLSKKELRQEEEARVQSAVAEKNPPAEKEKER